MGKTDKLLAKFLNSKKTFEWDELVVLFSSLGYVKKEMQGSRVRFFNAEINHTIFNASSTSGKLYQRWYAESN
ncbi:hypothetical protein AZZ78_005231 [Klebsiella pneumoniae]|nr:hypothetical protein AZZ78_005231 [Klebsiella pneumoniae]